MGGLNQGENKMFCKDTVSLTISSIVSGNAGMGYLHVYRELDDSEVEIMVDFYYDYQPSEKATLDYPGCEAYIEITGLYDSATGKTEYNLDCIDNINDVEDDILNLIKEAK